MHPTPISAPLAQPSSGTLISRRVPPKRAREAGGVLPATGFDFIRAMGREIAETGRIAAYLGRAIVVEAGKDMATLAALALFLSGFVVGMDTLATLVLQ